MSPNMPDGLDLPPTPANWEQLTDIENEMNRQDEKWGEQHHRNDTGPGRFVMFHNARILANLFKRRNNINHDEGNDSWADILLEEVFEALAEDDPEKLYIELKQVAAVAGNWMKDIKSDVRN